jgi:hypothetical protein
MYAYLALMMGAQGILAWTFNSHPGGEEQALFGLVDHDGTPSWKVDELSRIVYAPDDEGDIDFVKAIRVYREVGYPYMLMPDHVPIAPNDPNSLQSFAYCYGYIRALLQALEANP